MPYGCLLLKIKTLGRDCYVFVSNSMHFKIYNQYNGLDSGSEVDQDDIILGRIIMGLIMHNISTQLSTQGAAVDSGMQNHSNRQLADTPSQQETRIMGQNLWERVRFLVCRRKPECPEKTYQGGYGICKPNSCTTTGKLHW